MNRYGPPDRSTEAGQVEAGKKPRANMCDHLDAQDREAPENEEVHPAGRLVAWERLLADDELLLPQHVLDHGVDALGNAVEAVHGRDLQQDRKAPVQRPPQAAKPDGEQGGED